MPNEIDVAKLRQEAEVCIAETPNVARDLRWGVGSGGPNPYEVLAILDELERLRQRLRIVADPDSAERDALLYRIEQDKKAHAAEVEDLLDQVRRADGFAAERAVRLGRVREWVGGLSVEPAPPASHPHYEAFFLRHEGQKAVLGAFQAELLAILDAEEPARAEKEPKVTIKYRGRAKPSPVADDEPLAERAVTLRKVREWAEDDQRNFPNRCQESTEVLAILDGETAREPGCKRCQDQGYIQSEYTGETADCGCGTPRTDAQPAEREG